MIFLGVFLVFLFDVLFLYTFVCVLLSAGFSMFFLVFLHVFAH